MTASAAKPWILSFKIKNLKDGLLYRDFFIFLYPGELFRILRYFQKRGWRSVSVTPYDIGQFFNPNFRLGFPILG